METMIQSRSFQKILNVELSAIEKEGEPGLLRNTTMTPQDDH